MVDEKPKFERKRDREGRDSEEVAQSPKTVSKAEAIMASSMPESQKKEYLKQIGAVAEPSDAGKVPFHIFAKVKKVPPSRHKAMLVYPKARGISLATIEEWEQIFKSF
jgi:hypothetical protein